MTEPSKPIGFVAPEPDELASFFPGYEIQYLIASGGMGAVYRARQTSLEREVAIKILPKEFSGNSIFRSNFETEARAMARLNHVNLIGVYHFGEAGGMPYIIMEYVHGKSLHRSANGVAIEPSEVIRLISGICKGLAHAHAYGVLHRDIKPSNILLDSNAQPKICDFGLAGPIKRTMKEGEVIYGTPGYTAPEVGESPASVDHRADIFSVGVLLHELLTGKMPADDPRSASVISRCDSRFDAIIRRATRPMATDRYASVDEFARDLQKITRAPQKTSGPEIPPVSPTWTEPPPQAGKSSHLTGVLAFVVVCAIGYGVLGPFLRKVPERETREKQAAIQVPAAPRPAAVERKTEGQPVAPIKPVKPESPFGVPIPMNSRSGE